jgi:hypothetical protein
MVVALQSGNGKEVRPMLVMFIVSVAAGVVSHYICKWLDGE